MNKIHDFNESQKSLIVAVGDNDLKVFKILLANGVGPHFLVDDKSLIYYMILFDRLEMITFLIINEFDVFFNEDLDILIQGSKNLDIVRLLNAVGRFNIDGH